MEGIRMMNETQTDLLFEAILSLKDKDECRSFFQDLCTFTEVKAMAQRMEVARLLDQGLIYSDILEKTGTSSATISRINRALQYGSGGYRIVLDRLKK